MIKPKRRRATIIGLINQYAAIALMIIQGLVLVPLYLKYIPNPTYGGWLATGNVLTWLGFIDPGASAVLQQRSAQIYGEKDESQLAKVIGSGIAINLVISLIMVIAVFLVTPYVPSIVNLKGTVAREISHAFALAGIAQALLLLALAIASVMLGLMAHPGHLGISYLIATSVGILTSVGLLLFGTGIASIPLGLIVRSLILLGVNSLLLFHFLSRKLQILPRICLSEIRTTLFLSSYTWFSRLGTTFLGNIDGVLLARYIGAENLPAYMLTKRAADLFTQIPSRLGAAFTPSIAHLAGANDPRLLNISKRLFSLIGVIAITGSSVYLALNQSFVNVWVGSQYYAGTLVTFFLAIATTMSIIEANGISIAFANGKIRQTSTILVLNSAIRAILMFALLHWGLGYIAIPLAMIGGSCLGLPLVMRVIGQLLNIPKKEILLRFSRLAAQGSLMFAAAYLVLMYFEPALSWPEFLLDATVFGSTALVLIYSINRELRLETGKTVKWISERTKKSSIPKPKILL